MKCLLLTLGLALVCGIQATVIPHMKEVNIAKLKGNWYTTIMVASDMTLLKTDEAPLKVCIQELQPTPEGDMKIVLVKRVNDTCMEKSIIAQKTEDPAMFEINYQGNKEIFVLGTDYTHYLLFCVKTPAATEKEGIMCQGLARTLEDETKVMEKFKQVLMELPEQMEILLDLTGKKEKCCV